MTAGALLSQLSQSVSIKCKLCSSWQVHSNHWIGINWFACSPGGGGNDAATQALITGAFEEKKKIAMARAQALADTLAKSESLRKGAVLASSRGASGTCQWFNGMTKVYLMCVCVANCCIIIHVYHWLRPRQMEGSLQVGRLGRVPPHGHVCGGMNFEHAT